LRTCPAEAAPAGDPRLQFIKNEDARESMRIDVGASHRALGNGEYKGATVLAGSVIESLLLHAILERPSEAMEAATVRVAEKRKKGLDGRGPEWWHLVDYIEVALELGVIDEGLATAARLSADFRNLIHPGRVLRKGQTATQGIALSTVGTMERLIEHLEENAA
jgi:hypothetical protein